MKSVYSAVRTGALNKAVCASSLEGCFKGTVRPYGTLQPTSSRQEHKTRVPHLNQNMKTQIARDVRPYQLGNRANRNAFIFSIKQSDKRILNAESGGNTTLWNVNKCVTNSGELNTSREATMSSASQDILWILWDPKVHYHIHMRPSPVHILYQNNPVHASPSHFLVINFNIIFSKCL